MAKKQRASHFALFRGHTVLKHGVLDRYVKAWIQILKRKHPKIWIIDGFAGKGMDDAGQPGSPLLLARSAAELREEGAEVQLIAIEADRDWYQALKTNLATFDVDAGGSMPVARLRLGTLAAEADEAFSLVGDAPVFVFLDPFGAEGLTLEVVKRALSLPKGEVFALFSHRAVVRHLAVLRTDRRSDRALRAVAVAPSLFPDLDAQWLARELAEAGRSDASLAPTKEAAERILVQLFGRKEEVDRILALPDSVWAEEVLKAYLRVLKGCGATHTTPIAIFDEEQQCTYYLIHGAKNPLAVFKMKEAVSAAIRKSALPAETKQRIRWAHRARIDEVVSAVRRQFAGEEVRWTNDPPTSGSVRMFALSETRLFTDQIPELKDALEGYVIEKSPLRFRFPEMD